MNKKEYVIVVYLKNERNRPDTPVSGEGILFQFEVTGPFDLHT